MSWKAIVFAAAGFVAPWGCGASPAPARQEGVRVMSEVQEKAQQILRLRDEEYATLDDARVTALSLKLSALFPTGPDEPPGPPATLFLLSGPKSVDPVKQPQTPLLAGIRYTGRREWEVHFDQNACLVAVDLRSGQVRAGWPFILGKRQEEPPPSGTGTPPGDIEALTVTSAVRPLPLLETFPDLPTPSRLALTLVLYDWASNTITLDVVKEGRPLPAVSAAVASAFLLPSPAGGPGASLKLDAGILRASIDLPADQVILAPAPGAKEPSLLPAAILFRKLDLQEPVQVPLAAPVVVEGGRAKASFAVDLKRLPGGLALKGRYQAYLLCGASVAGPCPVDAGN